MSEAAPELARIVDPRHTALVVVDMQQDFCDPTRMPMSVDMLPRLKSFIAEARRVGVKLVFVQVMHNETTDSPVWRTRGGRNIAREGSDGAEAHPDFRPEPGDYTVIKRRYSAFIRTPLEEDLRRMGVETVIMTGIATNVCVESTARDAFQRDFYVVLAEDCAAAGSQAAHAAAVENVRRSFGGLVYKAADILDAWQPVAVTPVVS